MSRAFAETLVALALVAGCMGPQREAPTAPRPSREALRRTAYVEVFEASKGSIVKFTATRKEQKKDEKGKTTTVTHTQWGSGCIIHPAGYALTNSHMLLFDGVRTAETFDGKRHPVRVIAADTRNDLALMKIERKQPFRPLPLGRSGEAMIGEPAITIGSPFGIRFTMARGIISGLGRSTKTEHTHLHRLIQTDAAINPGSSGGPLLNILGELLGICVSAKRDAENIGFVIPIDHIRRVLPDILSPEQRYGYVLGLTLETCGPARVTQVAEGSPAASAGIREGDLVTHVGGMPIRFGLDVTLALIDRKGGEKLPIRLVRADATVQTTVSLGSVPFRPADKVDGLVNGVDLKAYSGRWSKLPDFAKLKPTAVGHRETVALGDHAGKDGFGLDFRGYVNVARDGVYIFHLTSDDGSRLWIGDRLVVDNDGLHSAQERRGFIPLRAGKHPLRVAMFDAGGGDALALSWEGPALRKQPIPAAALWRRK
ncbi:trypsin-like peptidase domain-containing protein [Planctomycetota bacterium]